MLINRSVVMVDVATLALALLDDDLAGIVVDLSVLDDGAGAALTQLLLIIEIQIEITAFL